MNLSTKLDFSKVNYAQENVVNLIISATAPKLDISERKPVNIIAVTDISGSMSGPKLDYAKKSLMKMIDHLSPSDTLGIVTFDGYVRVIAQPSKMTQQVKDALKSQVQQIHCGGSTNFAGGMMEGLRLAGKIDGDCRVIIFTDGQPTDGATTLPQLSEILRNNMQKNTSLSCFGYGNDHVSALLTGLADVGKGNYAYVQNPDDALSAFARELGGLLSCYAQNLKFKVSASEGVKINEVLSDVNVEQIGDEIKISIPDLYSEETRHLVVELTLPKQKKTFPRETTVATVELEYDNKDGKAEKAEAKAKVSYVKASDVTTKVDQAVLDQLALVRIQKAQTEAQTLADSGQYAQARACFLNVNLSGASSELQSYANTMSANYADSHSYTSSVHTRNSAAYSLRKGRSSGISGAAASASPQSFSMSNAFQDSLIRSFTQDQGSTGTGAAQGSAGVTTTIGVQGNVAHQALQGLIGGGFSGQGVQGTTGTISVTSATPAEPEEKAASTAQKKKAEKKLSKKRSQTQW